MVLFSLLLAGCSEVNTTDPVESYTYWAGARPPKDLKVIKAKYWESAHWTKEYILYLKIKPTNEWWDEFIKQNNLSKYNDRWAMPTDSPEWFKMPDDATLYVPEGGFSDSRFFRDNLTGECYTYDLQFQNGN